MSLEENKEGIVQDPSNIEEPNLETPESVEDLADSFIEEIDASVQDFENEDWKIQRAEESVSLSNPDTSEKVKQDMRVVQTLADLNNQAHLLKQQTEAGINNITGTKQEAQEGNEVLSEDFQQACGVLLRQLEELDKDAETGYVFSYGSIIKETSAGKALEIDTLSWMSDDGYLTDIKKRLVLVAKDLLSGRVVGLRLSDIRRGDYVKDADGDLVSTENVTGEILTGLRGEGLATAIDTAFTEILSRVTNEWQQQIPENNVQLNWNVENRHLRRIEESQGSQEKAVDEDRTKEQQRWQSLYGVGGKFGLQKTGDYNYTKVIRPDVQEGVLYEMKPVDIKKFQEIKLALKEASS